VAWGSRGPAKFDALKADSKMRDIHSDEAPAPRGTYSQAVVVGSLLFCSTQLPVDPASGKIIGGTASEQAAQCLVNLDLVCRSAGTSIDRAVLVRVYFTHREDWPDVERTFARQFVGRKPARVPVHVSSLASEARVSVEATVACMPSEAPAPT
jgi:2-iminobutanoate/2-iminopropanoate deaminase